MSSPERRAAKSKTRDRRKLESRRKAHLREIAKNRRRQYPLFEFCRNGAPEEYCHKIEQFYRNKFDFDCLPSEHRKILKLVQEYGWADLESILRTEDPELSSESFVLSCIEVFTAVGEAAFSSGLSENLVRNVPYLGFTVLPAENLILIDFQELKNIPARGGLIYYAGDEPKVKFHDSELTVGFSRHAIERLQARLVGDWASFRGAGYVDRLIDGTCLFEPTILPNGQDALSISFPCFRPYLQLELAEDLAGPKDDTEDWYLRLAYGPVVQCGDFLKTKTILFPGFRGTPEFEVLDRELDNTYFKKRLLNVAKNISFFEVAESGEARELFRWFHKNAVPQVVRKKREPVTRH